MHALARQSVHVFDELSTPSFRNSLSRIQTCYLRTASTKRPVPRRTPLPRSSLTSGIKDGETSKSKNQEVSNALRETADDPGSGLAAPVHIPEDPHAILRDAHPSTSILANSTLVIQRQFEMMNVLVGFEQANKYVIMDPHGNHIGFLAEQDHGIGRTLARQAFRTHRSFTTHVFDKNEKEVLRFHRPFSWINSRIRVFDASVGGDSYTPSAALDGVSAGSIANQTSSQTSSFPISSMRLIGEAQQQWAPLRRKYNLFLHRPESALEGTPQLTSGDLPLSGSKALEPVSADTEAERERAGILSQFAYVNEPFLSWDFTLKSADDNVIGSVNRNFAGFAREIFTDTGVYALRMDSQSLASEPKHLISHTAQRARHQPLGMTLDQRAVMLATAVSIDFDYFSRHSHAGGGWFFPPIWIGGGEAGGEAGAAGAAEGSAAEAGALGQRGASEATSHGASGAWGGAEGAMSGAGTMAGYEAMQRGMGRRGSEADDASPQASDPNPVQPPQSPGQQHDEGWGDDGWPNQRGGNDGDSWSGWGQGGSEGGSSSGDGGGGGGGGGGESWFDGFF